jgi:hypothetical protein
MTQASCNIIPHSKQTLTRRAALTSVAAVAVATIPALAQGGAHSDAELIELGRQLDELLAVQADAIRRAQPNWDAWKDVLRKFGERHAAGEGHITNQEYIAAGQEVDRQCPIAFPHPDDVNDAMYPISCRIMALPAHTLAGLAVKAKLAKDGCANFWDKPFDDADWDHKVVRTLIDAVLRLGAVQS